MSDSASKLGSVSDALELYVAPFDDPEAWADVLRRAEAEPAPVRGRPRRRLVAVALAAVALGALAVSPVGGALARGVGDFSNWLSGSPGEPASDSEQHTFESERSWASFPDGPQLRRLIVTSAGGATFELFGFRTGDSLCLRLTVDGFPTEGPARGCVPLRELRAADSPVLPVLVDASFGQRDVEPNDEGMVPPRASATFGVVADGVARVEQRTASGSREAVVANNAFLAVTPSPPLGLRTKALALVGDDGERRSVPLAESPIASSMPVAKPGIAPGPTRVERHVERGTIGWLLAREERGQSPEEAGVDARFMRMYKSAFARVITPDPVDGRRVMMVFADRSPFFDRPWGPKRPGPWLCYFSISRGGGAGGGCSPAASFFGRKPFTMGFGNEHGGDQYSTVAGLATDDVARMELYLATGERIAVPLADNAYIVDVARTKFPIRLVAYDGEDRIIGIDTYGHDPMSDPGPRPVEGKQRVLKRVTGANGVTGTLRVGPSTEGGRCWRISFSNGAGGSGCRPKRFEERHVSLTLSTWDGDSFLSGDAPEEAARIELRFANGLRATTEPIEGGVLHHLTPEERASRLELAVAYDAEGHELARQRFRPQPTEQAG